MVEFQRVLNTFCCVDDAGLYGLVPIIADIRGFFSRYNWTATSSQLDPTVGSCAEPL
jgi:hypothetical protein